MGTRQLCRNAWILVFALLGVTTVNAQQWVEFVDETSSRLVGTPGLSVADNQEKDYAWGDVDQDGDIDVVCVRKEPFTTPGARANVLFMNEGIAEGHPIDGVLVDRTALYASASDVAGDQGFLTATNDRDVVLHDLNGDGWLDMATAVTLADNQPVHIKMPRVYINLGDDPTTGDWLGFQRQGAWIPDLSAATPVPNSSPRFCAVAVADVNTDGLPDLYFGDYDAQGAGTPVPMLHDYNDRCLINTGTAFVDQTTTMFPNMLQPTAAAAQPFYQSTFSASVTTADMNGDGVADLIKQSSLQDPRFVAISYANSTTHVFDQHDEVYNLAAYFVSAGDLNNDGKNDLVIVDDFEDRIMFNQGTVGGQASFDVDNDGTDDSFNLQGSTSEFGGNSVIADLDNDGWNDVIVTDVDVDIPGCNRRMKLFRNLANPPLNTLNDVAGAQPWTPQGVHDVAVFDLNADGWLDMIVGTCTGTRIWINDPPIGVDFAYPNGQPSLVPPGQPVTIQVQLTPLGGQLVPDTHMLNYSLNQGPYQQVPLTDIGGGNFEFTFPGAACGTVYDYFLTSGLDNGQTYSDPASGADKYRLSYATVGTVTVYENFESGLNGWTVANTPNLITGAWGHGVPNGTTVQGQPAAPNSDAGPAPEAFCMMTQNGAIGGPAASTDVDGGPTLLYSPTYDLAGTDALIEFDYWFISVISSNNYSPGNDRMGVAISTNGGSSFSGFPVQFEHEAGQWRHYSFNLGDFVTPTDEVVFRFAVNDVSPGSITEAALDNFQITPIGCPTSDFVRGDIDADGAINLVDAVALLGYMFNAQSIPCVLAG
ncbi:MAG: FG-GAP-like repeat-containing protein, partial [Planctomycetota bacterium]